MATRYESKCPKYEVGMLLRTYDVNKKGYVKGEVTEVGDHTIVIQWEDLIDDTEYEISKITLKGDILLS